MVSVLGSGTWGPAWLESLHCVLLGQDMYVTLRAPLPTNDNNAGQGVSPRSPAMN